MKFTVDAKQYPFLEEGGEMGELTIRYDWSKTPVGPIDTWPQSLKTTVGVLLHSGFPMFLWWGEEMTQFYNDAYRPSLGQDGKHPKALGQPGKECWPEIWTIIYPLIDQVRKTKKSFFLEDQLIPIFRNGKIEDVYWTFSSSAVVSDDGRTEGVLVVCTETTGKVNVQKDNELSGDRLRASESNLKNVILQAPVAMCILKGHNHVVEIANDRMFELWGKPAEEGMNKPVFDFLPEAKAEGFEDLLNNVFRTGETYSAYGAPVTLYRNGTTDIAYIHFVYEAFRGNDNAIAGVMVVATDVTEEVIASKKLEERESQIRSLVESAPFPIGVYVGREMRIEMLNQAILEVWGKGSTGLIGKTYHEVLPELNSQDIYEQLDRVYTTGKPFHARNQRVDLMVDGKLQSFYFNYSFTPLFDAKGKVYGVMNTAAEVTDLVTAKHQVEQSERNFRNIVRQAPVAMCILLGPEHVVEVANDLIIELWGKPAEQMLFKPIFEGLPEAREQGLKELLDNVYTTGKAVHANERPVSLIRKGKHETVYQNFVYEPYRDSDGTILGILAITIDVTAQVQARHQIEEVVAERTRDLKKSNAELSQFAYITSHDLQEPIRKISTFVEMLSKTLGDSIDARAKSYIAKIDSASARMLRLIRDVLTLSQLSRTNEDFQRVDLNEIFTDIKNDYELLIEEKGCVFESDKLPTITAIPVQMSQLFTNLVSNALKFARKDEKLCLTVTSSVLTEEEVRSYPLRNASEYCKIEFTDNGIGFNQDNAVQIFDIFQRLHGRNEYAGTGIGLAMCKKIVENHGGYIYASSKLNEGSTFTVILPLKASA
jgi:PAS domain S-box-containing protein